VSERTRTHGKGATAEHRSWTAMRTRCNNPKQLAWPNYGGRGITVCERWDSFENFLADMGERPSGCSLDRIDNNGNYEPGNCRWATKAEQSNNRRTNIFVTHDGETLTITQWCTRLGISNGAVRTRMSKNKVTPRQALGFDP
jgi:hypothetical protein